MNIFGMGLPEMAVILVLALLIFGPKKLPEIGSSLGKAIRSFQDATRDFEKEFKKESERIEGGEDLPSKSAEPARTAEQTAEDKEQAEV